MYAIKADVSEVGKTQAVKLFLDSELLRHWHLCHSRWVRSSNSHNKQTDRQAQQKSLYSLWSI